MTLGANIKMIMKARLEMLYIKAKIWSTKEMCSLQNTIQSTSLPSAPS